MSPRGRYLVTSVFTLQKWFDMFCYSGENLLGRSHIALGIGAIHHLEVLLPASSLQIDLPHIALQVERLLVDILRTTQVLPIGTLTLRGEFCLREAKGDIEEQRQCGAGNLELLILGGKNPLFEPLALLLTLPLGALVSHIRIDIPIDNHTLTLGNPLPDLGSGVCPIARIQESHKVGIDLLHGAKLAPKEASNHIAIDGSVKPRKVQILTLPACRLHHLAEQFYLCGLTSPVQTFKYYKHLLKKIENFLITSTSLPLYAQRQQAHRPLPLYCTSQTKPSPYPAPHSVP